MIISSLSGNSLCVYYLYYIMSHTKDIKFTFYEALVVFILNSYQLVYGSLMCIFLLWYVIGVIMSESCCIEFPTFHVLPFSENFILFIEVLSFSELLLFWLDSWIFFKQKIKQYQWFLHKYYSSLKVWWTVIPLFSFPCKAWLHWSMDSHIIPNRQ